MQRIPTLLLLALLAGLTPAQEALRVIAMPTRAQCEAAGYGHAVPIDDDLLYVFKTECDRAIEAGATTIVFEITTPGGYLETTATWLNYIATTRQAHGVKFVAYVPENATSAGAMLAVACDELILGTGAEIGNSIPIQFADGGAFREASPKLTTEWANKTADIAKRNGFNETLIRSMVDPDLQVFMLVSPDGQQTFFLTKDELDLQYPADVRERANWQGPWEIVFKSQAFKFIQGGGSHFMRPQFLDGFPHRTASSRDDLPGLLGMGNRPLDSDELIEMPVPKGLNYFLEILAQLDWTILLLIAGITCFVLEFKTPGLGAFGVAGILCLVGYFALSQGEGMPLAFTIGMLILGFFLLLAEFVIIPGFGVAGISGLILIFFSIYAATVGLDGESMSDRLIPDSDRDWVIVQAWATMFLGVSVTGTAGALTFAKTLHRIPFLNRAFVKPQSATTPQAATGVTAAGRVDVTVGTRGTADTDLRPSGHAIFPQGALDVVSEGGFIKRGAAVEVVLVEGHRVVVSQTDSTTGPEEPQ